MAFPSGSNRPPARAEIDVGLFLLLIPLLRALDVSGADFDRAAVAPGLVQTLDLDHAGVVVAGHGVILAVGLRAAKVALEMFLGQADVGEHHPALVLAHAPGFGLRVAHHVAKHRSHEQSVAGHHIPAAGIRVKDAELAQLAARRLVSDVASLRDNLRREPGLGRVQGVAAGPFVGIRPADVPRGRDAGLGLAVGSQAVKSPLARCVRPKLSNAGGKVDSWYTGTPLARNSSLRSGNWPA